MQLYTIVRHNCQSAYFYRWNSRYYMYVRVAEVTLIHNVHLFEHLGWNTMLLIRLNILLMKKYLHPLSLIHSISYGN